MTGAAIMMPFRVPRGRAIVASQAAEDPMHDPDRLDPLANSTATRLQYADDT
jgi:hypothetical protein